jgi:S-adenosylmethionine:tRNA ribosyltransferase-isomerase
MGQIPLPPYLQRPAEAADRERYQTIYARSEGSVAAPTAGLHFTQRVFEQLQARGMDCACVTLHVGAGTFKPVQSETIGDHEMHAEYFEVSAALLKKMVAQTERPVVAVGTTSLRTLESLFLMGCKLLFDADLSADALSIQQWDAYDPRFADCRVPQAFAALLRWMEQHRLERLVSKTQLLIAPGYPVRTICALVTNFHQPNSTLLLLVAAITGDGWRAIYDYALHNDFRFLSYGDGSLLFCTG